MTKLWDGVRNSGGDYFTDEHGVNHPVYDRTPFVKLCKGDATYLVQIEPEDIKKTMIALRGGMNNGNR